MADDPGADLGDGAVVDFVRPVALPGGNQGARFTIAGARAGAAPGTKLFVCQQHTPHVAWRAESHEQPNGATGVAEVIGIADDLAAIAQAYHVSLGDRVERSDDCVFLKPAVLTQRFGSSGGLVSNPTPRLAGWGVAVGDLGRAKDLPRRNDVSWAATGAPVLVAPQKACSALIVLS